MPEAAIGRGIDRKDGVLKVTGTATYAAEHKISNLTYAACVQSTIAKGRIASLDAAEAERAPGVLTVLTPANAPRLHDPGDYAGGGEPGEQRQPLQDNVIHYSGQHVAVVVADTFARARYAASLVKVRYETEDPVLDVHDPSAEVYRPADFFGSKELQIVRGDVSAALASSAVRIDARYSTPIMHHAQIEPHATIAVWNQEGLTLYETTQWVKGMQSVVSKSFGLEPEKIHIISPFVGGGFGGKGFTWPHTLLAAMAAQRARRPVKLVLSRQQMFSSTGRRGGTAQRIELGADGDGRLQALRHFTSTDTSPMGHYMEPCGSLSSILYACPSLETVHEVVRLNMGTPTATRAPGEATGSFALESAMDELAVALNIDPVELRIRNHAESDPQTGKPFSSKNLLECYRRGAASFGWEKRNPVPGSMRRDGFLVGWGFATASYPANRRPASARVTLRTDGSVVVSAAAHELGGGTYTTLAQIAADALGLDVARVTCHIGDSSLPPAPVAGGSSTTASVGSAVHAAALDAKAKQAAAGAVEVMGEAKIEPAGTDAQNPGRPVMKKDGKPEEPFSLHSFGAQFVEVLVDPELDEIRVSRVVSVHDIGRVANRKTAISQIRGAVIWGIGMGLLEETVVDPHHGRIVTRNLADYLVPVNPDIPEIEVDLLDIPDPHVNALGMRGMGEIGITGVAAAIANAVFHATGKRVRDLPVRLDKLI